VPLRPTPALKSQRIIRVFGVQWVQIKNPDLNGDRTKRLGSLGHIHNCVQKSDEISLAGKSMRIITVPLIPKPNRLVCRLGNQDLRLSGG